MDVWRVRAARGLDSRRSQETQFETQPRRTVHADLLPVNPAIERIFPIPRAILGTSITWPEVPAAERGQV